MNRSLVTVMVVGASAIVSVALAGFGAPSLSNFNQYYSGRAGGPSGGIWQNLMALVAPESGSTAACPSGYSWQPVGQTQGEPPTILYDCVADPKSKMNPANCPAWPTCLRALVPAGCTCTAPSIESPKETESSETIIQYNAGPTDSLTFSSEQQTEPADCEETVLCQAADGTNYEVCGSLQGPNPCRSSFNPPQCPTWPTCLRANIPAGCTCVAPAVEVVQPDTEGPGSAPVVVPVEPTAVPSPSPTTSLLRRFLPLPAASPLATLPPGVNPVATESVSPAPERESDAPSWLNRVRQNIALLWQRLF